MMTAITVLGVMVVIATPSLGGLVRSSKVRGAQSELISSFMLARSEAAKRGVTVSIAASAPTAGSEFSAGWTVWIDANADGVVDASETVIRSYPNMGSALVISAGGGTTLISFAPTGFLTPATAVNFKVCAQGDTTKGYAVALQPVGLTDINDQATCP